MHKFFGNAPTLVGGNCTRNDFFFFPFSTCSDPVLVEMRLEQRFSFFKKFFYYLFGNQGRWKPYPERKNVFLFSGISRSSLAKTKLEWSFLFLNFFSICLNHFFYLFKFFLGTLQTWSAETVLGTENCSFPFQPVLVWFG